LSEKFFRISKESYLVLNFPQRIKTHTHTHTEPLLITFETVMFHMLHFTQSLKLI